MNVRVFKDHVDIEGYVNAVERNSRTLWTDSDPLSNGSQKEHSEERSKRIRTFACISTTKETSADRRKGA